MFWNSFLCEQQCDELSDYNYWYEEWLEVPKEIILEE